MALLNRIAGALSKMAQIATTPVQELLPNTIPAELRPVIQENTEERRRQLEVIRARAFHEGFQNAKLTERLIDYLGEEHEFSLNYVNTVVTAVAERMILEAVEPSKDNLNLPDAEKMRHEAWFRRVWKGSRLKDHSADIHEAALRDGEHFVIIDWDNENRRPRFTPHKRYTDAGLSVCRYPGDGEGVKFFYPNDDPRQKPAFAAKRWTETLDLEGKDRRKRIALYFPAEVIVFERRNNAWVEIERVEWRHPRTGQALGIPVVVFRTPECRPEARRGWAVQRIVNKLTLDLVQICDSTAFRIWLFFGWTPQDENGKPIKIRPNTWIGSPDKAPDKASAEAIEGADPKPLSEILDNFIFKLASITDTPVSRLLITRQVSAEGTQKQQEGPLLAKIRRRAEKFGSAWEDAFAIARRLENAFGAEVLDENVMLEACWEPFETRSADEDLKEQEVEQARINVQLLKKQIDVSTRQLRREIGYTDEEIDQQDDENAEARQAAPDALGNLFRSGQV